MLKYVYNSCTASGRINDGLDLVRSQKRVIAFDYQFATQEGAILFNIHALDLKDELQLLLFELVKEKMLIWKQMRCLEIVAAIVAETLMEMSVNILTNPEEIHWPMGVVTKPGTHSHKKKGKKTNKKQGGVFGQLVSDLAPKVPVDTNEQNVETISASKGQKTRSNSKSTAEKRKKLPVDNAVENTPDETASQATIRHEGLPVQDRKCMW